jgi:hypothetical protein
MLALRQLFHMVKNLGYGVGLIFPPKVSYPKKSYAATASINGLAKVVPSASEILKRSTSRLVEESGLPSTSGSL